MDSVNNFMSLDYIKKLKKEGNYREIGRMAISAGTVAVYNELREFGAKLLSKVTD